MNEDSKWLIGGRGSPSSFLPACSPTGWTPLRAPGGSSRKAPIRWRRSPPPTPPPSPRGGPCRAAGSVLPRLPHQRRGLHLRVGRREPPVPPRPRARPAMVRIIPPSDCVDYPSLVDFICPQPPFCELCNPHMYWMSFWEDHSHSRARENPVNRILSPRCSHHQNLHSFCVEKSVNVIQTRIFFLGVNSLLPVRNLLFIR